MPIKYPSGASGGTPFTKDPTRTVVVTGEALDITEGYEGDTITYTATVKDSAGNAIQATFVADLMFGTTKVVSAQAFDVAHYNSSTFLLTLTFIVPTIAEGSYTVKLSWATQTI